MHFNTLVHLAFLEHKPLMLSQGLRPYSFIEFRGLMNRTMANAVKLGSNPEEMIAAMKGDIAAMQIAREERAKEFESKWSKLSRAERLAKLGSCECGLCAKLFQLAIENPHLEA